MHAMCGSMIYAGFAIIISALPGRREAATGYTRPRGPETPEWNIQSDRGKAKAYQVKQVLWAIDLLEVDHDSKK